MATSEPPGISEVLSHGDKTYTARIWFMTVPNSKHCTFTYSNNLLIISLFLYLLQR